MTIRAFFLVLGLAAAVMPAHAESVIRLGMSSLPLSLGNPFRTSASPTIFATSAMFDGLTRIDEDGVLHPWLATAWEATDEKTWRVTLRDDVMFSNGVPLTAEAAAFAINYLVSEESLPESLRRELPPFERAQALDKNTVEIVTAAPEPMLPRFLTALPMVEPGQWKRLGRDGFAREPIGTGPFQLDRWESGAGYFTAFRESWRPPKADRLEIIAVPDKSARIQALLSGSINVAIELGPEDQTTVEAGGLSGVSWVTAQVNGLSFILTRKPNSPVQDVRVREALNLAVNRDAIIAVLLEGAAPPATQGAPRVAYGYNPDLPPVPYDPERARALLAEAGYADGFSLVSVAAVGISAQTSVLQAVANDLSRIGVSLEVRGVPIQQYLRHLSRNDWDEDVDAFAMNWPAEPSIDVLRPLRLHSCLRREPWYCDQTIMPRIEAAMAAWDEAEGLRLRHEIMAWYRDAWPAILFSEAPAFAGLGKGVSGFAMIHGIVDYDTISVPQTP